MSVAVVSPHLDDAALSAWLVLTAHQGVRVISCFAGIPDARVRGAWDDRTGLSSPSAAIAARRAEDRRALATTGSEAIHLDQLDEQYRGGKDAALTELAALLGERLADACEVWIPAGIGGHVDHIAARDAALSVVGPDQRLRIYADLPYAGQPAWPIDVTGSPRDLAAHGLLTILGRPAPGVRWQASLREIAAGARIDRHVIRLSGRQRRAKVQTLHHYRSQLRALRCGASHPLRERRLFGHEVYWTLDSTSGNGPE